MVYTQCLCPILSVRLYLESLVGLDDSQIITKVTSEVGSGNTFLNGIIGMTLFVNDPATDVSSYTSNMDIISNNCIEYYLLARHSRVRSVSLYYFVMKMFFTGDLVQYISIIIQYLLNKSLFN